MPKDKREVESALLGKGFQAREGNHHYFVYYSLEGKKSLAKTKTSHAGKMKALSDQLIGEMARQCKLTKQQFLRLVDCPMSRQEYEAVLRAAGFV